MPSIGGVTYTDLDYEMGNGKASYNLDPRSYSHNAVKVVLVDYANVVGFINAIKFTQHPIYLGAYAYTFDIEPYGTTNGNENQWTKAKITIGYQNLSFDPILNKEVNFEVSAELISYDKEGVKFETGTTSADKRVPQDPQILLVTTECAITYHNQAVTYPSAAACDALIGKINTGAFHPNSDRTWAANTVIYKGYSEQIRYMSGSKTYDISHKFTHLGHDWRERYNPVIGDYDKVKDKVSGNYIYLQGDFSIFT